MATLFSVSSHHPFKIPEKYNGKFKQGKIPIHEPIEYSDFALKQFFKTAEKMPWYHNTIFVIVADHTNQVYYPEYQKTMNRFAIPILFFSPNENYNLHGEVATPAQQIDIYPTLTDLIGYNKPFRSWGRSLVQENSEEPNIIVNSTGVNNQFIINDYIYIFDGKDVIGIYKRNDADLAHNLISERNLPQHQKAEELVKKWFQDYNERIIDRNLTN